MDPIASKRNINFRPFMLPNTDNLMYISPLHMASI